MSIPNREYDQITDAALRLEEAGLSQVQARAIVDALREVRSNLVTKDDLKTALDSFQRKLLLMSLLILPPAAVVGILLGNGIAALIAASQ